MVAGLVLGIHHCLWHSRALMFYTDFARCQRRSPLLSRSPITLVGYCPEACTFRRLHAGGRRGGGSLQGAQALARGLYAPEGGYPQRPNLVEQTAGDGRCPGRFEGSAATAGRGRACGAAQQPTISTTTTPATGGTTITTATSLRSIRSTRCITRPSASWLRVPIARAAAAAAAFPVAAVAASAEAAAERSSERLLWGGSFWAVAREDSSHFCASKRVKLSAADLRARDSGQKMPNMSTVAALVTYVCT